MTTDSFSLDGRVIVVTGGHGKLGRYMVAAMIERGARAAVIDLASPDEASEELADYIGRDEYLHVPADITDRATLVDALGQIEDRFGAPDGLVNAAAIDTPPDADAAINGPFEDFPEEVFDRVMAVNVKGTFFACQVFGGRMATEGRGSIVNIGSTYGKVSPDQRLYDYRREAGDTFFKPVAYSVSKSALYNLTRYLATYWAEQGVRVNTVTFGGVFDDQDARFVEAYEARTPMGRMARPGDYPGGVIFLLSDASSYMTGADLVMDGGWTAW